MDNFELIVGRHSTLRLSLGTARLLYRGILALTALGGPHVLPEKVRAYIERRRSMLGGHVTPIDLPALLATDLDGDGQRTLAGMVRRIAMSAAAADSDATILSPSVRLRFVAALIEVYCVLCSNLPLDLTLPPPVGIAFSPREWQLIEVERARIRSESEASPAALAAARGQGLANPGRIVREEKIHRQISAFAG